MATLRPPSGGTRDGAFRTFGSRTRRYTSSSRALGSGIPTAIAIVIVYCHCSMLWLVSRFTDSAWPNVEWTVHCVVIRFTMVMGVANSLYAPP